jgi:two-component system, chemotaxis family, response regulator WspF
VRELGCPVLVVTSTIEGNLDRVYDALGAGALDAVASPTLGADGGVRGGEPVLRKIRTIRRLHGPTAGPSAATPATPTPPPPTFPRQRLVLLGASTGGPEAVATVLRGITPAVTGPILVVQHLDPDFVAGLAEWLAGPARRPVKAVVAGDRPEAGAVQLASSDDHMVLRPDGTLGYEEHPAENPYRPSVDVFFGSVARHWPVPGVAAILTGMGRDGAEGLLALRGAGWATFAQDEATSVVYGMPRVAREIGAAGSVLPISAVGPALEGAWLSPRLAGTRSPGG